MARRRLLTALTQKIFCGWLLGRQRQNSGERGQREKGKADRGVADGGGGRVGQAARVSVVWLRVRRNLRSSEGCAPPSRPMYVDKNDYEHRHIYPIFVPESCHSHGARLSTSHQCVPGKTMQETVSIRYE